MLLELTVTDLPLIERVRVTFAEGFTVITGETGAGKSLLIDALGLMSGARSDVGMLEATAWRLAEDLRAARRVAGERLGRQVRAAIMSLGFSGAAFDIRVADASLDATGADSVAYIFAPNAGEPSQPLARIASGGELSRVALAIETVLAGTDTTPTLVFDEVDAGIGGRSADPVGRCLWRLARDHQVICITHLSQIAAYADAHLHIRKRIEGARTTTQVRPLEGEERVGELAAMLGGAPGDAAARAAARELLARAGSARGEFSGAA